MRMQDKGVVITGGASGIGAATAERMVAEGVRVVLADMNAELGEALASRLGAEQAKFVQIDVSEPESVRMLFDTAESFTTIDVAFNSAGVGH